MTDRRDLEAVARAAVLAGGAELRRRYRAGDADGEYSSQDVKAAADTAAEERMLPVVRRAFPDHTVFSEEAGEVVGSEPYRWIIDPLDGTNNFVAGLPTFASSVAVLRDGVPELAAVYQPATDELYIASRGDGISYQGTRVTIDNGVGIDSATVVTIVGRDVPYDPELGKQAAEIGSALDEGVKRVLDSWAPTVHSGLFARGRLQGLVQFHPDEEEQAVTELFAAEAGAAIQQEGPLYVAASDGETLSALWQSVENVHEPNR